MTQRLVFRASMQASGPGASSHLPFESSIFTGSGVTYTKTLTSSGTFIVFNLNPSKVKPFAVQPANLTNVIGLQLDSTLLGICEKAGTFVVSLAKTVIPGAGTTYTATKSVSGAGTGGLDMAATIKGPCEVAVSSVCSLSMLSTVIAQRVSGAGSPSGQNKRRKFVEIDGQVVRVNSQEELQRALQQKPKEQPRPQLKVEPKPPVNVEPFVPLKLPEMPSLPPPVMYSQAQLLNAIRGQQMADAQKIIAQRSQADNQDEEDVLSLL